jgi:hypothetical protein
MITLHIARTHYILNNTVKTVILLYNDERYAFIGGAKIYIRIIYGCYNDLLYTIVEYYNSQYQCKNNQ